jgi:dTDP-4-amino-4,6-dideoxygalactose transaminase
LQKYLESKNIPSMIYYPLPLYKQEAFEQYVPKGFSLPVTEQLCQEVISLPIHTEFNEEISQYIVSEIKQFFKK